MSITLANLKIAEKAILWPAGEASNLAAAHNRYFIDGLIDLARWVDALQTNNTTIFPFCATFNLSGMTFINKPVGQIKHVFTIANDDFHTRVDYKPWDHRNTLEHGKTLQHRSEENTEEANDVGERPASDETDHDGGRARDGQWSIDRKRIWLTPWIQSNESVVVIWDGVKKDWVDSDVLDTNYWGSTERSAVRLYVKWQHELYHGCDEVMKASSKRDYENALADVIYDWAKIERRPSVDTYVPNPSRVAEDITAEELPE